MIKMKTLKKCGILAELLFLICSFCIPCGAAEPTAQNDFIDFVENSAQELWEEELKQNLPQNAKRLLEQGKVDSFSNLLSMNPKELFSFLQETLIQKRNAPFALLARLAGMILLCAALNTLQKTGVSSQMKEIFSVTAAVCIASLLSEPILDCIQRTVEALRQSAVFTMSFAPVMSGIMIAGGNPTSAGVYHMVLFFCSEILSELAAQTLIPLLNIYLALCLVSPLAPFLQIGKITTVIKRMVCWGLGILATVFVGILSLQTVIGNGGDSLVMKTSKFVVSSMIPIIGSTISEALGAAKSCVHLLKGVVGSIGILAAVLTFLPVLLEVGIWYCMVHAVAWLGAILDIGEVSEILSCVAQTFSILLAIVCSFMLMFLVSTTLILTVTAR